MPSSAILQLRAVRDKKIRAVLERYEGVLGPEAQEEVRRIGDEYRAAKETQDAARKEQE